MTIFVKYLSYYNNYSNYSIIIAEYKIDNKITKHDHLQEFNKIP